MKIIILGGCGYVGSVLVEKLIRHKHKLLVIDSMWFGNYLSPSKNLKIIKADVRNLNKVSFRGYSSMIHLANIANDPASELNPSLSWEVNVLATEQIINKAIKDGIKKFIYLSSGSVYGVKKEKKVTEKLSLVPISVYNKTKMTAERVLLSYKDKIKIFCIRPATICGFSPRMRFDLTVNILTMQAFKSKKITVHGGSQIRPNINIYDLIRVIEHFLLKKIKPGIYNAGFENMSVLKIAKLVKKLIPSKIILSKINDIRSYRLDSSKLLKTGFKPKFNVHEAIMDIKNRFQEKKIVIRKNNFSFN